MYSKLMMKKTVQAVIFRTQSRIHSLGEDNEGNLLVGTLLGGLISVNPGKGIKFIDKFHFLNSENDPSALL
jgi:hypothetical protein